MKNNKIYSVLPDGGRKEYDVILTFTNDDNNRDYIVYTDNSKDEKGNARVYLGRYQDNKIMPLEAGEKEALEKVINIFVDEVNKSENN